MPPHLHDLQEADLPENQRGLVISEIALFRERAVKKNAGDKTAGVGPVNAAGGATGFGAPSQPRERGWGQRQNSISAPSPSTPTGPSASSGRQPPQNKPSTPSKPETSDMRIQDPQSYQKAPEFVRAEAGKKTDEDRDRDLRMKKIKADEQEFKHVREIVHPLLGF